MLAAGERYAETLKQIEVTTIEEAATAVNEALEVAATDVRSAAEMWYESADNIEEGFGHDTYQSNDLRDNGDLAESFADELESSKFDDRRSESVKEVIGRAATLFDENFPF